MKGVAKLAPGDGNVGLIDVPVPEIRPGHVIIEVKAAGVCGTDIHIYHGEYASNPPVIMGHEVAGIVTEIGEGVTNCKVGDRVTCETYFYVCGQCQFCRSGLPNLCPHRKSIGSGVHGGFTRYVLVPDHNIHHLPANVDEVAGALSEPLTCCVHALERTRVEPGEIVVVSGPGAIGLLMAQVVKVAGATTIVLGTTADAARLAMAKELGADLTIDVMTEDAKALIDERTDGVGADVVFECAGAAPSARSCLELVRRRGRYGQVGLFGRTIEWDLDLVCYKEVDVHGSFAHLPSAWRKALNLLGSGQVQTRPLVSAILPITEWHAAFDTFERR
ncbi:MAG: zinc-binding dehydrogenase, partial [Caldilineaceae bacterium]|nr:zinc-binding dehydrogenase [Caldilineaceae bacterium]